MRQVTIAATQMACGWDRDANVAEAEALVREAAARGANVVLLQELFETPYFCADQKRALFEQARPFAGNKTIAAMSALAAELGVVLPISFFEKGEVGCFNSLAMAPAARRCRRTSRNQTRNGSAASASGNGAGEGIRTSGLRSGTNSSLEPSRRAYPLSLLS